MDKQSKKIKELFKSSRQKKFWISAASLLAFAAVFTTIHFLILPAATMEKQPICGIEEHQHADSCYKDEKVLVCELPEDEKHTHTDECYKVERTLICTKKEHVHTAECFEQADLKADKESEEDWKRSVAAAKLNGNWAHDVLAVAKTQIDYSESEKNFVYSTDGEKMGYTRYGDWFGNKYADWNTMFVSFCLNYAEVPQEALPYKTNTDIKEWVTALKKRGLYKTTDKDIPEAGDLLFLDNNKDGKADDVAIINEVKSDEAGKGKVTAIKGNEKDKVTTKTYSLKDKSVAGFGRMAKAQGKPELAPFATKTAKYGRYWKAIRSTGQLRNGKTYIIVGAEGNYAASYGNSAQWIDMQPVKGNPDYYLINNLSGSSLLRYVGNAFQSVQNGNSYINPTNTSGSFGGRVNLIIENSSTPACFHISTNKSGWGGGRYYLNMVCQEGRMKGIKGTIQAYGGNYRIQTADGKWVNAPVFRHAKTGDFLILEETNTTLNIPDDAKTQNGGNGQLGTATKPKYDPYLATSDKKTGTYEDPNGTVNYYSDPSTSKLEQYFGNNKGGKNDFEAQKRDDGKALMDKSVIYGHDDYNAIENYEDGTFGVTLSALGQSFVVNQTATRVPLDVLFIMDLSTSMGLNSPGSNMARAQIVVNSVNRTIQQLMSSNPENRFAAVGFNSNSFVFYEMGHHNSGFSYGGGDVWANGGYRTRVKCTNGTFTQIGLAEGYEVIKRVRDTTYTKTINGQQVKMKRKPVIILLSDGQPSHSSPFYMDVLRNPYHGDAHGENYNAKGIHGYYGILSSCYLKSMTGIHYDNPATMYTVALSMREYDASRVGKDNCTNHYRATYMNPTPNNINYLSRISNPTGQAEIVERQLYKLLQGQIGGCIDVGAYENFTPRLSNPHRYEGIVLSNPYRGHYNYADKAYLNNSGNNGVDAPLNDIINVLNRVYDYSYETQANEPLIVTDPIGDGMEIKGDPVLRFNGKNYQHSSKETVGAVTTYKYTGVVPMDPYNTHNTVDLSTITVTVETDSNGLQTAKMIIPPKSLPIYTADETLSFYYEALPVRLIYKVGLSHAGQNKIASASNGETVTFYTNRYTGGVEANGSLKPSNLNNYYKTNSWPLTNNKTDNTTETLDHSLIVGGTKTDVSQRLGNNGKLVITKKGEVVNKEINVEKKWLDYESKPTTEKIPEKITATLYRTYNDENGKSVREDVLEFTLEAANGWKKTFTSKDLNETAGREYQYYVNEEKLEGYKVKYEGDGVNENTAETPIVITNKYIYSDFVLPSTGGPGTVILTSVGVLLMTSAVVYGYVLFRKKRKDESK